VSIFFIKIQQTEVAKFPTPGVRWPPLFTFPSLLKGTGTSAVYSYPVHLWCKRGDVTRFSGVQRTYPPSEHQTDT